jgi:hypothetical protein
MDSYRQHATETTPEILLSPDENRFIISGKSAPEDVRSIYYPVIEWMKAFADRVRENNPYTGPNPLLFKLDFEYFNSSSAKFFFDIILKLKELKKDGVPLVIEWYYDADDSDMREAGEDLALLCEMQFKYCPKTK